MILQFVVLLQHPVKKGTYNDGLVPKKPEGSGEECKNNAITMQ